MSMVARQMVRWGFKRVVLARELSAREIKTIVTECPSIEIESFCHGSLCYSYSVCVFLVAPKILGQAIAANVPILSPTLQSFERTRSGLSFSV